MICIFGHDDYRFSNTVVTIGKFDALHIGHKALMERMNYYKGRGLTSVVLRLDIKNADRPVRSEDERIALLEALGIDVYIRQDFTERDARMSAEEFVKSILVDRLGVKAVVVGEDFRFGHERRGDVLFLREEGEKYGFETAVLPKVTYEGDDVSSSRIRKAIKDGRTAEAAAMLEGST